ncbi:MAG TPA: hypothetical protein VNW53_02265 [Phenylobacterium sp.]|jgi:hypothetical protein|uniref:hypothetical protein n=1 Tax=Phenylobacterium sp. TaxID=1871053 RepID=UPI002C0BA74B|nr:hypothetical protein [Phenylobacterium sp.]HXA37799.1 hypothetical protein [Phenylobacterium sp.]
MSPVLTYIVLSLLLVGTCLFAIWKGGPAERMGASVILAMVILERLLQVVLPKPWWIVMGLTFDALTAIGLLVVTVRYGSLWLGGAMLLYAAQFTLHSFYLVTGRPDTDLLHMALTDFNFGAILVCLVVGTGLAWRGRQRARDAVAIAAP